MSSIDFWDGEADGFDDEADHGLHDPIVRGAWRDLLERLLPRPPARVLDVGCGTGTLAVLLAASGYTVTGVDFAPGMIAVARVKARAAGLDVTFIEGDASHPPVRAGTFDVVLCRHVLGALPDAVAAVGSWVRLLKTSGTLVLIEGLWGTGAGLPCEQVSAAVCAHRSEATCELLEDPDLWGRQVSDDRFVVVSRS